MNLFEISFALIERSLFMTADNLTFSLEIDFIPDIQEGRMDLKAKMKEVAAKYAGTYVLDPKARPIISGLSKEDVENALKDLGLQAFGTWPSCILTCTINTPLPLRAVGMSDGWDIYTGKKTFFAFAQFPADALTTSNTKIISPWKNSLIPSAMKHSVTPSSAMQSLTETDPPTASTATAAGIPRKFRLWRPAISSVRKTTSCRSLKYIRKWDPSSWNTACPA